MTNASGDQRGFDGLADALVGDQAGHDEAECSVGEQEWPVPQQEREDGELEEHTEQQDGGEESLAMEDHEPLQQAGAEVGRDGDSGDDPQSAWVGDEGQAEPARCDHPTGEKVETR
ncbi:hypothetical protein JOF56_009820 [Kibdelosporangium banguiense]|uniref:Uncharacterized protein n=1 Tax=Kibdelosporangium banguiense TaxID=1365924 RepID=A0ABS4TZU4_9PSEU|nr:hypothetical protein [Kibdelosporangium banguiense]